MFPKRGAVALVTTVLGLVLLLSFKTPDVTTVDATVQAAGSAGSNPAPTSGSSGGGTSGAAASAAPAATSATTAATATTITGSTVSTRYGDVAVEVTVASGKITAVEAVSLPSGGRSGQISAYAAPVLASEALTGAERIDRHRVRRDLHEPGLCPVAPERPRPGRDQPDGGQRLTAPFDVP